MSRILFIDVCDLCLELPIFLNFVALNLFPTSFKLFLHFPSSSPTSFFVHSRENSRDFPDCELAAKGQGLCLSQQVIQFPPPLHLQPKIGHIWRRANHSQQPIELKKNSRHFLFANEETIKSADLFVFLLIILE